MALDGTLQTLSLPNLIQLQCGQPQPSRVRLVRGGREGTIAFANGELIFASLGELAGEEAVYELLSWPDGEFHVLDGGEPPPRNVQTPWGMLVLDSLRRLDEVRAEQSTTPAGVLQEARRRELFKRAVIADDTGKVLVDAANGSAEVDAALVAFLASRFNVLSTTMSLGPFQRLVSTRRGERMCIDRLPGGYLGCWMDERASVESLKEIEQALASCMK